MALRFLATQLSRPTGIGGWLIRAGLNRGNARLNRYALDQMQLAPEDRVVELGFGGAVALPRLLGDAAFICGVDRSQDVVGAAARRFADAVHAGQAEFRVGAVEKLPLPDAAFTKALSVHTLYFGKALDLDARSWRAFLCQAGESRSDFCLRRIWTG